MITKERILEAFDLSDCGTFLIHKFRPEARPCWNSRYSGKRAFTYKTNNGYYRSTIDREEIFLHQAIWILHYGKYPDGVIDHINGDTTDNRIENLRESTVSQNGFNRGAQSNNKSCGLKGVTWDKARSKWKAAICHMGKRINIGRYDCIIEAKEAYDKYCLMLHGEFARTR